MYRPLTNSGPELLSRYSYWLRAGSSVDRIPVGTRFSAPVHTGPGAHPASCTLGTGSFPGVKQPGRAADHSPPSSAKVKERVELNLYNPSGPSWPVIGWTLLLLCPWRRMEEWTDLRCVVSLKLMPVCVRRKNPQDTDPVRTLLTQWRLPSVEMGRHFLCLPVHNPLTVQHWLLATLLK